MRLAAVGGSISLKGGAVVRRWLLLVCALAVVTGVVVKGVLGASDSPAVQSRWLITDLGTLGGPESEAVGINNRGQVIGLYFLPKRGRRGFVWESGRMRDLGSLGGGGTTPKEISERGQIVGSSFANDLHAFLWESGRIHDLDPGGSSSSAWGVNGHGQAVGKRVWGELSQPDHATLWDGGKMRDLGTLSDDSDSWAVGINDRGQIIGRSGHRAFLWENGKMTDLGVLHGGEKSRAVAVNERGQVVGFSDVQAWNRAFLWQNGKLIRLRVFASRATTPVAINDKGQVVMNYLRTQSVLSRVCVWESGSVRDLGTLGGVIAFARDMNAQGQIVGRSRTRLDLVHAFVWQDGKMTDLGALPGGRKSEAMAINNQGQIVGWSTTKTGAKHAVLWRLKPR